MHWERIRPWTKERRRKVIEALNTYGWDEREGPCIRLGLYRRHYKTIPRKDAVIGFHFVRDGYGPRDYLTFKLIQSKWGVGTINHVKPSFHSPIECCVKGLHSSPTLYQASGYGRSGFFQVVESWGECCFDDEKMAAEFRRPIIIMDWTELVYNQGWPSHGFISEFIEEIAKAR